MTMILIIIVFCWFLYKCGAVSLWLELFTLENYHTQPITPEQITPAPPHQETQTTARQIKALELERMQAEKIAANILTYQGYKKDAFKLVKGLDSETLNNIINDFRNDLDL